MDEAEAADRLLVALGDLGSVAQRLPVEDALRLVDTSTLEVFWREWPLLHDWVSMLWQRLDEDLAGPAAPAADAELDETGGGD